MTGFFVWHNLLFYLPITFALLLVLASAMGLADLGGDYDVDVDVDMDVDVDLDIDTDVDADVDADADADADGGSGPSFGHSLLGLLGVGRVPLSILMMASMLIFGGVGASMKMFLEPTMGALLATGVSAGVAFVVTLAASGLIARGVSKIVPSMETYAKSGDSLIGSVARAQLRIDPTFGLAQVTDESGTLMEIRCRSYEGRIAKGSDVLITEYDPAKNVFTVVKEK